MNNTIWFMDELASGINSGFGVEWVYLVLFLIISIVVVSMIVKADVGIAGAIVALPFLIILFYSSLTFPAWGVATIVIVLGLILSGAIYQIFLSQK